MIVWFIVMVMGSHHTDCIVWQPLPGNEQAAINYCQKHVSGAGVLVILPVRSSESRLGEMIFNEPPYPNPIKIH